ncbi:MAG TPA: cupin domain-containing protein [Bryobacteraceae bacterium]|nr:cupin domain-containing protein [Bryobacteraceae bacterium]
MLDTGKLEVVERLPGWFGRYFHSEQMTFAHYDFKRGASIHEHFHPQEEVYEVIEGELQLTIDGVAHLARPGVVAIVPPNARHSVKALTEGARSSSILRAAANLSAPATAEESRRAPLCTLLS